MIPAVSVLLSVRDGMPYLPDAIGSIVVQSLRAWELVVVLHGCRDTTDEYVNTLGLDSDRLRLIHLPRRGNLAWALNQGLAQCRGEFVARQDADDISDPRRLARQVGYMRMHASVALLGSAWDEYGPRAEAYRRHRPPEQDADLRALLRWRNPLAHSSVMFRREVVTRLGGYDESYPVAQDYDLWLRIAAVARIAALPDVLVIRRALEAGVSRRRPWLRRWCQVRARWAALRRGALSRVTPRRATM